MRKIYMYKADDGRIPIEDFLNSAHKKIKAKFQFMLNYIKDESNILCEPYVKHFQIYKYKMLYELRLRAAGTTVRIIYYMVDENIILLHAFNKRDKRDTEHALEHSLKVLKSLDGKALYPFDNLKEVTGIW